MEALYMYNISEFIKEDICEIYIRSRGLRMQVEFIEVVERYTTKSLKELVSKMKYISGNRILEDKDDGFIYLRSDIFACNVHKIERNDKEILPAICKQ